MNEFLGKKKKRERERFGPPKETTKIWTTQPQVRKAAERGKQDDGI